MAWTYGRGKLLWLLAAQAAAVASAAQLSTEDREWLKLDCMDCLASGQHFCGTTRSCSSTPCSPSCPSACATSLGCDYVDAGASDSDCEDLVELSLQAIVDCTDSSETTEELCTCYDSQGPAPFDCLLELAGWETLWSQEKKHWCCANRGFPCTSTATPTTTTTTRTTTATISTTTISTTTSGTATISTTTISVTRTTLTVTSTTTTTISTTNTTSATITLTSTTTISTTTISTTTISTTTISTTTLTTRTVTTATITTTTITNTSTTRSTTTMSMTATLSTSSSMTASVPVEEAQVELLVHNIDYDELTANTVLEASFKAAIMQQFLLRVPDVITEAMVEISLSRGSVRVSIRVALPGALDVTVDDIYARFSDAAASAAAVTRGIRSVPDIQTVATGTIFTRWITTTTAELTNTSTTTTSTNSTTTTFTTSTFTTTSSLTLTSTTSSSTSTYVLGLRQGQPLQEPVKVMGSTSIVMVVIITVIVLLCLVIMGSVLCCTGCEVPCLRGAKPGAGGPPDLEASPPRKPPEAEEGLSCQARSPTATTEADSRSKALHAETPVVPKQANSTDKRRAHQATSERTHSRPTDASYELSLCSPGQRDDAWGVVGCVMCGSSDDDADTLDCTDPLAEAVSRHRTAASAEMTAVTCQTESFPRCQCYAILGEIVFASVPAVAEGMDGRLWKLAMGQCAAVVEVNRFGEVRLRTHDGQESNWQGLECYHHDCGRQHIRSASEMSTPGSKTRSKTEEEGSPPSAAASTSIGDQRSPGGTNYSSRSGGIRILSPARRLHVTL